MHFYMNLTWECNYKCKYCNRLKDVMGKSGLDGVITPSQALTALDKWQAYRTSDGERLRKGRLKIGGGEPLLFPKVLREVCKVAIRHPLVKDIWVMSNGSLPRIELPVGCQYRISSVSDKSFHEPFLISPEDMGIPNEWREEEGVSCETMKVCGRCFDTCGFTFCPVAGGLGELLGVKVYSDDVVVKRDEKICRHCPYSLNKERMQGWLLEMKEGVKAGVIEYPSRTWKAALREYHELV